jgi:hypothetical protein
MATAPPKVQFDDLRFGRDAWMPASRKRLFLALYIDYLIVGASWALVQYVIRQFAPSVGEFPSYGRWVLFGLFELLVFRFKVPSVGATVLSMKQFSYRVTNDVGLSVRGKLWFVDSWVKKNESWFSMIVAFLFVSDGVKTAVRWILWNPPLPVFGMPAGDLWTPAVYVTMGAVQIAVGYHLFKLSVRAFKIALPYLGAVAVSALASWDLWDPYIAEMMERRRVSLGQPEDVKRVLVMQAIMPEAMLAALGALSVCLIILFTKYRRLDSQDPGKGNY